MYRRLNANSALFSLERKVSAGADAASKRVRRGVCSSLMMQVYRTENGGRRSRRVGSGDEFFECQDGGTRYSKLFDRLSPIGFFAIDDGYSFDNL